MKTRKSLQLWHCIFKKSVVSIRASYFTFSLFQVVASTASHQPAFPGVDTLSSDADQVVASTASHETAFPGVDTLSSDADCQFELKGMEFPSAPPSVSEVYTSDKLNFM